MTVLTALAGINEEMVTNARELEAATAGIKQEWNEIKISLANFSAPGITAFLQLLQAPLSPDSAAAFLRDSGLQGSIGMPNVWGQGNNAWEAARGQEASGDRWELMADRMAERVGGEVRDAMERR